MFVIHEECLAHAIATDPNQPGSLLDPTSNLCRIRASLWKNPYWPSSAAFCASTRTSLDCREGTRSPHRGYEMRSARKQASPSSLLPLAKCMRKGVSNPLWQKCSRESGTISFSGCNCWLFFFCQHKQECDKMEASPFGMFLWQRWSQRHRTLRQGSVHWSPVRTWIFYRPNKQQVQRNTINIIKDSNTILCEFQLHLGCIITHLEQRNGHAGHVVRIQLCCDRGPHTSLKFSWDSCRVPTHIERHTERESAGGPKERDVRNKKINTFFFVWICMKLSLRQLAERNIFTLHQSLPTAFCCLLARSMTWHVFGSLSGRVCSWTSSEIPNGRCNIVARASLGWPFWLAIQDLKRVWSVSSDAMHQSLRYKFCTQHKTGNQ